MTSTTATTGITTFMCKGCGLKLEIPVDIKGLKEENAKLRETLRRIYEDEI